MVIEVLKESEREAVRDNVRGRDTGREWDGVMRDLMRRDLDGMRREEYS